MYDDVFLFKYHDLLFGGGDIGAWEVLGYWVFLGFVESNYYRFGVNYYRFGVKEGSNYYRFGVNYYRFGVNYYRFGVNYYRFSQSSVYLTLMIWYYIIN